MAIQLVIEESPVCFVRSLRTNRAFYLQARSFSFEVQRLTKGNVSCSLATLDFWAHWRPVSHNFEPCNGVVCLFAAAKFLTKLEAVTIRSQGLYALTPGCSSQLFLNELITRNSDECVVLYFMNKCWPMRDRVL